MLELNKKECEKDKHDWHLAYSVENSGVKVEEVWMCRLCPADERRKPGKEKESSFAILGGEFHYKNL